MGTSQHNETVMLSHFRFDNLEESSVLRDLLFAVLLIIVLPSCEADEHDFLFRDVSEQSGFLPAASALMGHGAGWGDINGDGWPDLYLATFHYQTSRGNQLLQNNGGQFSLLQMPSVEISTRGTGVLFSDLDNDGDQDLYVGSMPGPPGSRLAERHGHAFAGCSLFENDGHGRFTDVSQTCGACPAEFGGRSVTVLDFDGDGLLDLLVGEDPISGYNGSPTRRSRLFRNLGGLQFEDVTDAAGIPKEAAGLGVAAADVNQDGWPDFILTSTLGSLLMLNDGKGRFQEATSTRELFHWPDAGGDNMICGVCIADVNNDLLPDVMLGQHFGDPWVEPVACRLYLHQGLSEGQPQFLDITDAAGLPQLSLKGPHVEIQDFDNDGLPDLSISMVRFSDGRPYPTILKNLGTRDGIPRFRSTTEGVNDFPTAEDRGIRRSGAFFEKMIAERKVTYTAPGPSCDFDRDGRLDFVMPSWWPELPSLLLRNETSGGHWLQIQLTCGGRVNRPGIGARIHVYRPGAAGQPAARLGSREIAAGFGYASGQEPIAHFGLGQHQQVDLLIDLPHGRGTVVRTGVDADQLLRISID